MYQLDFSLRQFNCFYHPVCGGTLGIFIARALQLKGHDVCVIERGQLRGREQEWNISMKELLELVDLEVLTTKDVNEAVTTEFPTCRSGFKNREGKVAINKKPICEYDAGFVNI